jgi:hypothetical protein
MHSRLSTEGSTLHFTSSSADRLLRAQAPESMQHTENKAKDKQATVFLFVIVSHTAAAPAAAAAAAALPAAAAASSVLQAFQVTRLVYDFGLDVEDVEDLSKDEASEMITTLLKQQQEDESESEVEEA